MGNIFGPVDWGRLFGVDTPLLEIFLRGSFMYLAVWALLRFTFRRDVGSVGIPGLLVIVLIADAAQNAMAGDYHSITDGVLLVATIIGWAAILDWLAWRFPRIERIIHPPPLKLVENSRVLRHNLRKEMITPEELLAQLRLQGIERLDDVKVAHMEPDGRISVIRRDGSEPRPAPDRRSA